MKKRFSEEQIIGFLREAEAGMAVKELCRRHGFSEAIFLSVAQQVRRDECVRCQAAEGTGGREHPTKEVAGRVAAGNRGDARHCEKSGSRTGATRVGAAYEV